MQALIVSPGSPPTLRFERDYREPAPGAGEVLIRVDLAGICATDLEIVNGYLSFSGVPGHEFVGTVLEGPGKLRGRRIVAEINCACGHCDMCVRGWPGHCRRRTVIGIAGRDGAFAERIAVPAANCHVVPDTLSDEQAVFAEPLAAALRVTQLGALAPGARVAVLGTGRLGLLVAQVLAREKCRLELVGRNDRTLALARRLGLPAVAAADFELRADYDVVVECTGAPAGLVLALALCRPRGTIVLKSTYAERSPVDLAPVVIHELHLVGNRCGPLPEALDLLAGGAVRVTELITATYPLARGAEAFAAAAEPGALKVLLRPGAG